MAPVSRRGRPLARKPKARHHRLVLRIAPALFKELGVRAANWSITVPFLVRQAIHDRLLLLKDRKGAQRDTAWVADALEFIGPVSREGYPMLRLLLPPEMTAQVRAVATAAGESPEDWMADAVTMKLERLEEQFPMKKPAKRTAAKKGKGAR